MKRNPILISLAVLGAAWPSQAQNIAAIDPAVCEQAADVCVTIAVEPGGELPPVVDVPVVNIGGELEGVDPRIFQTGVIDDAPTGAGEPEVFDPRAAWAGPAGGGGALEVRGGNAANNVKADGLVEAKLKPAKTKAVRASTKAKKTKPLAASARGKSQAQGFLMLKTAATAKKPVKSRQGKRLFLK